MNETEELIEALEIAICGSDSLTAKEIGDDALVHHRDNPKILFEVLKDVAGSMDCELSAVKLVKEIIAKYEGNIN